jgi:hypothetical protein
VLSFHPRVYCLLRSELMTQTVETNCSLGPFSGIDWESEKVVAVCESPKRMRLFCPALCRAFFRSQCLELVGNLTGQDEGIAFGGAHYAGLLTRQWISLCAVNFAFIRHYILKRHIECGGFVEFVL